MLKVSLPRHFSYHVLDKFGDCSEAAFVHSSYVGGDSSNCLGKSTESYGGAGASGELIASSIGADGIMIW